MGKVNKTENNQRTNWEYELLSKKNSDQNRPHIVKHNKTSFKWKDPCRLPRSTRIQWCSAQTGSYTRSQIVIEISCPGSRRSHHHGQSTSYRVQHRINPVGTWITRCMYKSALRKTQVDVPKPASCITFTRTPLVTEYRVRLCLIYSING